MEEIEEVAIDIDIPMEITTERNNGVSGAGEDRQTLMKKLDELPGKAFENRPVTIFRLPSWYSTTNQELCEPMMVSIGPYHHGKESFRTMEEHKWFLLRDFLARNENVDREVYLEAMRSIEAQARQCYSETLDMESDDFVMMLLLDGCCILEWFLKYGSHQKDAICHVGWAVMEVFFDFFLLENQLPFFVIHKLFAIQNQGLKCDKNCEDHCSLLELLASALNSMCADLRIKLFTQMLCPPHNNINHLLHLLYAGLMTNIQPQPQRKHGNSVLGKLHNFCGHEIFPWPKFLSKSSNAVSDQRSEPSVDDSNFTGHNIPCISELHDAGIKFTRKKNPLNMFDIAFENGTIEMPVLTIDTNQARMIWNMVAFEQTKLSRGSPQILSSYLALMDSLINTEKDVALLERSGTIENYFQNAEELAAFFNQFGRVFTLDYSDHYFYWLYMEVKEYSKSTYHAYRAQLKHKYFSNPWSIISVVAAGILLILTFIQTYYSPAK